MGNAPWSAPEPNPESKPEPAPVDTKPEVDIRQWVIDTLMDSPKEINTRQRSVELNRRSYRAALNKIKDLPPDELNKAKDAPLFKGNEFCYLQAKRELEEAKNRFEAAKSIAALLAAESRMK